VLLKVEGSTAAAHMGLQTLHGSPMASKNLPAWSGIYPGLLSSYEVVPFYSLCPFSSQEMELPFLPKTKCTCSIF